MKNICRPKTPRSQVVFNWQRIFRRSSLVKWNELPWAFCVGFCLWLVVFFRFVFFVSNFEVVKVGSEKKWNADVETGNGRDSKVTLWGNEWLVVTGLNEMVCLCLFSKICRGRILQHLGHDVDETGELGVTHGYTLIQVFSPCDVHISYCFDCYSVAVGVTSMFKNPGSPVGLWW